MQSGSNDLLIDKNTLHYNTHYRRSKVIDAFYIKQTLLRIIHIYIKLYILYIYIYFTSYKNFNYLKDNIQFS